MTRWLSMFCVLSGAAIVGAAGLEHWENRSVRSLDSSALAMICGGDTCYAPATTSCPGTGTDCGTAACKRAIGTLTFTCGGGNTPNTYTEYQTYDHSARADDGYYKKDSTKQPCFIVFICGCDDNNDCLTDDDGSWGIPNQGAPGNIYPEPTTDEECWGAA